MMFHTPAHKNGPTPEEQDRLRKRMMDQLKTIFPDAVIPEELHAERRREADRAYAAAVMREHGVLKAMPEPKYQDITAALKALPVHSGQPGRLTSPAAQDVKASNPKDAIGDTKVPLALCSPIAEAHWSAAQFAGMTKYGAWNWRIAGVRASVYVSAMKRHIAAYVSGETFDPHDETHHLGNVMACAAILLDAEAAGKLKDDRPPSVDVRQAYAQVQLLMEKLKLQYADKNPHHYTIAETEKPQ